MSFKTTKNRDTNYELARLLNDGKAVVLYVNELGSYTAWSLSNPVKQDIIDGLLGVITDDRTPGQAVARLADKVYEEGDYGA